MIQTTVGSRIEYGVRGIKFYGSILYNDVLHLMSMYMSKTLHLDPSLPIYRLGNGIQLIAPELPDKCILGQKTTHTVGSVLSLPFNFYFLNTDGNTQIMNEESALMCGFSSAEDAIGKSLFDVSTESSAKNLIENCCEVINDQTIKIFEEQNIRKDGLSVNFLSIKCPWYNHLGQVIGVFGCSIVLGKHGLASSLSNVMELGLFNSENFRKSITTPPLTLKKTKTYLSKRELECLQLTIKGFTAKRIARELGISYRTVEEYIANIRIKMGASSKAELIEMTIDELIPL